MGQPQVCSSWCLASWKPGSASQVLPAERKAHDWALPKTSAGFNYKRPELYL